MRAFKHVVQNNGMERKNYIYEYYQEIKSGGVVVGKWIRLLYEYIIRNLENKTLVFDQTKANDAIDWIEKHCFHVEGALAPNPLKLELWQKAMVSCLYGLCNPKNGKRAFRECVLLIARKNGKTLLASSLCKYSWYVDGGYGARVFCIAPKLAQADLVYNTVWHMTQLDPEWKALKKAIDESKNQHNKKTMDDSELARHTVTDLRIPATNSTVQKIPFSERTADGFNPSLVVADEVASWRGDKSLKQYEVMKSGMGAREMGESPGILLSCSTAGYENDGIYDELYKRATRFLLGDSNETKLLPFLYVIDDLEKWDDINELQKSNPNLSVSVSVDFLLEEIEIARGSLSKKSEFLTKYCCVKQNSSLAWLSNQDIEKCCGEPLSLEDFRSSYAVIGLDLSQSTDLTSCVCLIERDGELYAFAKFWLPSAKIEEATARDGLPYNIYMQQGFLDASGENYIDYRDCYNWITSLVEEYEILPLKVGYDKWSAQYLVQDLTNYGAQCDSVRQGENLWCVLQELEGIIKDGKMHIGDNSLLKAHFFNSAIRFNSESGRGKLIKLYPKDHIDGMYALVDAMTVRQKWYDEIGERLQNIED